MPISVGKFLENQKYRGTYARFFFVFRKSALTDSLNNFESSFVKGKLTQIFFWMEDDLSGCSVVDSSEGMVMFRECGERRESGYISRCIKSRLRGCFSLVSAY